MIKENVDVVAPTEPNSNTTLVGNGNKPIDAKTKANVILSSGDPVVYILDTFNSIHIGDRNIGELLILSAGSACIKNGGGIHPKLSGASGKGKSHACKTMLHLIPKKFWENTSLSDKALYYNPPREGTILFSDDTTMSTELEEVLRRSTSDFQQGIEHTTVDAGRNGKTLRIPPRIIWWLASVNDEADLQTLNRQVGVSVDGSTNTDQRVLDNQLDRAVDGGIEYPDTDEVLVCKEMFGIVKKLFVVVAIPFAKDILWRGGDNRRNLDIFLDMLKVYTLFNHRQRRIEQLSEDVYMLYAEEDDFRMAAALYNDRAETQSTKLNALELKIMDFLAMYSDDADINTIANAVGTTYETARRLLNGRNGDGGMLDKVVGLQTHDIMSEVDGQNRRRKVYSIINHDIIGSYTSVVSLKES